MYSAFCLTIGVQFHFKCLGKRGADNKSPPYGFTLDWLLENLHPGIDESQHKHIRMYLERFDKGSKKRLKSNPKLRSALKTLQDDTLLTGKLIDYFDFLDGSVRLLGQVDQDQAQVPRFPLLLVPTAVATADSFAARLSRLACCRTLFRLLSPLLLCLFVLMLSGRCDDCSGWRTRGGSCCCCC